MTQPSSVIDPQQRADLIARADSLRPRLWEDAPETDRNRRLSEVNFAAVREAGLLKLLAPTRFGGYGGDMGTYFEAMRTLGQGCGSMAWVAGVMNTSAYFASNFSEQAQRDVWEHDPDSTVCGILAPTSKARSVEGGIILNGKWGYTSGVLHADWVQLCFPGSEDNPGMHIALAPVGDLTIEDTWHIAGMRGTGSNTVIAEELFIPAHRTRSVVTLFQGDNVSTGEDHSQRVNVACILPLSLAGAQIGMAEAAVEYATQMASKKPITTTKYKTQAESVGFQVDLAEASALVSTARTASEQAARVLDEHAQRHELPSETVRTGLRASLSLAARHAFQAVDLVMTAHGASAFMDFNPLQRLWRDTGVASRHAAFTTKVVQEIYGRSLLDQDAGSVSFLL